MTPALTQDHDGDLTPESRAAILGEVLAFIATRMEPVPYSAVLAHVMDRFQAAEELVSLYVMNSALHLCSSQLIQSNTFHSVPAKGEEWLTAEAHTTIGPSRKLTGIVFSVIE